MRILEWWFTRHVASGISGSFLIGSFVGLVIAGSSLGSLIASDHKSVTAGVWLGIGLWLTLVSTVRACVGGGGSNKAAKSGSSISAARR